MCWWLVFNLVWGLVAAEGPWMAATCSLWHYHHSVFVQWAAPGNSASWKVIGLEYFCLASLHLGQLWDFCVISWIPVLALKRRWECATKEFTVFKAPVAEHLGIKDEGSLFLINQSYISIKEFKFIHINNSCTYYALHSECGTHINLSLSHSNRYASVIIPVLLGENDTKGEILVH